MSCQEKTIVLGNSLAIEHYVSGISPETGKLVPAEDLSLVALISAENTIESEAIHEELEVSLTEGESAGIEMRYHGVIPGSAISEHLEAGDEVFLIIRAEDGSYRRAYACEVALEAEEFTPV